MFRSIVVGTDGSDTATEAVRQAVELARTVGGRLQVVTAYEPSSRRRRRVGGRPPADEAAWTVHAREDVDAILDAAARVARVAGVEVETHARLGDPADAILDVAEETKADVIVVGNRGMTGARRFLLGSVPNKVSHHAPCSVLIIRTT
jgi:nucleotide-binding universal stress UspA family protein